MRPDPSKQGRLLLPPHEQRPYQWITAAKANESCDEAAEVCKSTYACGGEVGVCSGIKAWTPGSC